MEFLINEWEMDLSTLYKLKLKNDTRIIKLHEVINKMYQECSEKSYTLRHYRSLGNTPKDVMTKIHTELNDMNIDIRNKIALLSFLKKLKTFLSVEIDTTTQDLFMLLTK